MNTDISTEYQQECSFPIRCECGKRMLSTSLFRHRKTKTHILIMQKPENINNESRKHENTIDDTLKNNEVVNVIF